MSGEQVTRDTILPVDADEAWELVGTEDGLRRWLAPEVELAVELDDGTRRVGVVERVEPPHELVFRWRSEDGPAVESQVSIVLVPAVAGTRVVVRERLGAAAPGASAAAGSAWRARLAALAAAGAPLLLA